MNKELRTYKDTMFRMLFKDKVNLLSLYNALNGTHHTDPDELEVVTLENAVYMNMKNDVAMVLDNTLSLYEHQSTLNSNMPLRSLFYVSKELQAWTRNEDLYSSSMIRIPAPVFVMFYNGTKVTEDVWEQRLSDMFLRQDAEANLELTVKCYNVRAGHNRKLLAACRTLGEYALYVERIRTYAKDNPLEEAVERAITECIDEGILADFLKKNRTEAMEVCLYEYDEEKHIKNERRLAFEEGLEQGEKRGLERGIETLILDNLEEGRTEETILCKLQKRFALDEKQAKFYFEKMKCI